MTSKSVAASASLFALALLCAAAPPLPAAADGIEPGLWQITETIIMNGNRTPSQMRTRCLSAEQAGDTAATFSPEYRTVNSDCERAEFSSTASRLKWRMLCKGQLDMDVSGDFTFDTPKHYSAKIESKGSVAGRTMVETSVTIDGEHLGECK
jgi:Protein of unknown function (DUF3617)